MPSRNNKRPTLNATIIIPPQPPLGEISLQLRIDINSSDAPAATGTKADNGGSATSLMFLD